jgi:hypothetical protein
MRWLKPVEQRHSRWCVSRSAWAKDRRRNVLSFYAGPFEASAGDFSGPSAIRRARKALGVDQRTPGRSCSTSAHPSSSGNLSSSILSAISASTGEHRQLPRPVDSISSTPTRRTYDRGDKVRILRQDRCNAN